MKKVTKALVFVFVLFLAVSGLFFLNNLKHQRKRNDLCGQIRIGHHFSVQDFFNRAGQIGMESTSLRINPPEEADKIEDSCDLAKQVSCIKVVQVGNRLENEDLEKLRSVDKTQEKGDVFSTIGFPTHFTCRVTFSQGVVTNVRINSFD